MSVMIINDHNEWYSAVPRRIYKISILGFLILFGALGGFGYWAFSAPLAAAVISQGSFVATGQNKIVQHLEGGIIHEINVSEGDHVTEGQPLLRLDETTALANERQFSLRSLRLEAIDARLRAEYELQEKLEFPEQLQTQSQDPEVAAVLSSQREAFYSSKRKLESDILLLESNIQSLQYRAQGYDFQRESMERQLIILRDEYEGKNKLYERGYMRKPDINAIERAIVEAEGQIARLKAEVSETGAQIERYKRQKAQTIAAHRQTAVDNLGLIEAELDSVHEQARNAISVLKRSVITAPVSGTVVKLHYHTAGGVIESGKSIAEIIPSGVPLIIETQISRTDIDSVRVGHPATVRLSALNQRVTPVLQGEVEYVSADALPISTNGQTSDVYFVRVSLASNEITRIPGFVPTPGMPAEILIQTAERTFFDYLSKPIVDSMARAFKEQ
ncbi:HlyD family type I secretion periplasmic adaptor subunit [Ahrensia sp. 13_GOM-1096m]|uniref:HlyD family type I secretion periplasmic adaptor subunit n=1 Tax=Ahrensia sp. 13_GOM-1096m TaxID=1380380 RepID=UPI00047E0122|nr:HlyD family type I secretion periplasmic adaptor subunit [Ahrensia sp. 13_GOM-1096m]